MGKLDIDNSIVDADEFETDQDVDPLAEKAITINKDMRRRLEDRMEEVRLKRELREYDFRDI